MSKITMYVVSHKEYKKPENEIYSTIQVGNNADIEYGVLRDNTGDNIAYLNGEFCELTAFYWIWKNDKTSDVVGVCHYRRFFSNKVWNVNEKFFLNKEDIDGLLEKYQVILPIKNFWRKKTVGEMYDYGRRPQDIEIIREIINKQCPEYLESFERVINSKEAHYRNMFVSSKKVFDEYCEWLFSILFSMKKELSNRDEDVANSRMFGFVSEFLLDVWIKQNGITYTEKPIITLGLSFKQRALMLIRTLIKR